jgi:alpha-L-fucosidase
MLGDPEENEDVIPPHEYWGLAEEFDPENYDPDEWLAAASEAGVEYAVLTTKHHDGFAMWPSNYGGFSTAEYLDGRDLVGEFVDACRRHNIKVGFYYSLADWHHPLYPGTDALWEDGELTGEPLLTEDLFDAIGLAEDATGFTPGFDAEHVRRFEEYYRFVKGQIQELITRYGKIDLFHFDWHLWSKNMDNRMGDLYGFIRSEQPHIVLSGRNNNTFPEWGDYRTVEVHPGSDGGLDMPDRGLAGWWEANLIWDPPGWGYTEEGEFYDTKWVLDKIAQTNSKGGNLLLNVGPTATGEFPDGAYDGLEEIGDWMDHSEPAIKDAKPDSRPPHCEAPVTRRTGAWYVHVMPEHEGEIEVIDVPEPNTVQLLRTNEPVSYEHVDDRLVFELPEEQRASGDEVVVVTWPRALDEDYVFSDEDVDNLFSWV